MRLGKAVRSRDIESSTRIVQRLLGEVEPDVPSINLSREGAEDVAEAKLWHSQEYSVKAKGVQGSKVVEMPP